MERFKMALLIILLIIGISVEYLNQKLLDWVTKKIQ